LPLATLRLHQAGSGLYLKYVSLFQIAPFSSRALPGTQQPLAQPTGLLRRFFKGFKKIDICIIYKGCCCNLPGG